MMRKIVLTIWIIITLLLATLLVLEVRENKRLTEENKRITYKMEGYADMWGELRSVTEDDWQE